MIPEEVLRGKSYFELEGGYIADTWNVNDGIPGSPILSIARSTDGYIWLGTFYGLARFDGQEFTVFDANTPGFPHGRVSGIIPAANGSLWLNVRDEIIQYSKGTFHRTTGLRTNPETRLSLHTIRPDGTLVYSSLNRDTRQRRLMSMKGARPTEHAVLTPLPGEQNPPFTAVTDHQGTTWWSRGNKLGTLTEDNMSTQHVFNESELITAGPTPARSGGIWLAVDGRILRYNGERIISGEIIQEDQELKKATSILEVSDGSLWVKRTKSTAQEHYVPDDQGQYHIQSTPLDIGGPLVTDAEGTLWTANATLADKGLSRIRKRKFRLISGLPPEGTKARSFLQKKSGNLLLGTIRGILEIPKNQLYGTTLDNAIHQGRGDIWTLTANQMGDVFGGKYATGLSKSNQRRRSASTFSLKDGAFIPIDAFDIGLGRRIVATCYDLENRLWVGSSDGGLAVIEDNQPMDLTAYENRPTKEVLSLACGPDGTVWIGTGDNGIYRYKADRFEHVSKASQVAPIRVRAIAIGQSGDIWFGTGGQGIYRFRHGTFQHYSTEHGLPSNEISTLIDDHLGSLWFGSYNGIHRVSFDNFDRVANGEISYLFANSYSTDDGLPSLQCNAGHPSSLRTDDGNLWFATSGGPCYVNPKTLPLNKTPPTVLLENLSLDGRPNPISQHRNNPTFRVPSHVERIEIQFSGLNFSAPDEIRFRYRVKEISSDWTDIGPQQSVVLQDLAPGNYQFQASAANNSGLWNEDDTTLTLKVEGAIWRSAGFQALGALGFMGLVSLGFLTRISRDKRRKTEQERFARDMLSRQEADRKRIARELHDSLEQNLLVIKNRAALTLRTPTGPDAMGTALQEISDISLDSIQEVRSIANNLRPYQIDRLGLTKAIQGMLNQIGDASEIEIEHEIEPIPKNLSAEKQINLFRIIQEAMNNCLKHAEATRVIVTLLITDQMITLRIKDNGRGFDPDLEKTREQHGFGLSGIRERATMFKGSCELISSVGNGTEWVIRFPLPHQA